MCEKVKQREVLLKWDELEYQWQDIDMFWEYIFNTWWNDPLFVNTNTVEHLKEVTHTDDFKHQEHKKEFEGKTPFKQIKLRNC